MVSGYSKRTKKRGDWKVICTAVIQISSHSSSSIIPNLQQSLLGTDRMSVCVRVCVLGVGWDWESWWGWFHFWVWKPWGMGTTRARRWDDALATGAQCQKSSWGVSPRKDSVLGKVCGLREQCDLVLQVCKTWANICLNFQREIEIIKKVKLQAVLRQGMGVSDKVWTLPGIQVPRTQEMAEFWTWKLQTPVACWIPN